MVPMMYPFSRLFSVPSTAMVTLTSVNIFLGTTSTLAVFIVGILGETDEVEIKEICEAFRPLYKFNIMLYLLLNNSFVN